MHYTLKILYTISLIILFLAILHVSSINVTLNKKKSTNNPPQNNDAKANISFTQIFWRIVMSLYILLILCLFYFFWKWKENIIAILHHFWRHRRVGSNIELENREQQTTEHGRESQFAILHNLQRLGHVDTDIELENREQQRTSRTESCVGPSGKHKRENEGKDESEYLDMRIWHTNVGFDIEEDIEESVVPTLMRGLSTSAKTFASNRPGPSSRKSNSSSGVSVSATKIRTRTESCVRPSGEHKRETEGKDESEYLDMRSWHTNEGYDIEEDIEEPVVPTLIRGLSTSAKTFASNRPGPSSRKSNSSSGVSVSATKIRTRTESCVRPSGEHKRETEGKDESEYLDMRSWHTNEGYDIEEDIEEPVVPTLIRGLSTSAKTFASNRPGPSSRKSNSSSGVSVSATKIRTRTESCVRPSGEHKRETEGKDESEYLDMRSWHTNEGYDIEEDIEEPVVPTLIRGLSTSAKTFASNRPGPSSRKSNSSSGVSVSATKIRTRTESCVRPSGEHKRETEGKDESEYLDMRIWHTNVGYDIEEDIKESVVPTLIRGLSTSAKTFASNRPGPSSRKSSSSSGVSVSATKITDEAEVYATEEKDD